VQVQRLDRFNKARIANAAFLSANLQGVTVPVVPDGYRHVFHQYTIRVPDGRRNALREYLASKEIGSGVYYPVPIHKQTYYMQDLGYDVSLPEAEKAAEEVLSLPVHPGLDSDDLEAIVRAVNEFWEEQ
jgi:perosamine synthetase